MNKDKHIPQGYKDSPLGIIPKEWELKRLGEIVTRMQLGGNYENSSSQNGVPLIKMGNIGRGKIIVSQLQYLAANAQYDKSDILKKYDLLFNTRNTMELVGKVAIWKNELPLAVYNSNLLRIEFNKNIVFSNIFANYYFNSDRSLDQLKRYATGTTSVAAIYSKDLLLFKFVLPSLDEQKHICSILQLWDTAIEKQSELIEKLKLRKRALMQQLLTGKKRLLGFSGEWKRIKAGDIFMSSSVRGKRSEVLLSATQEHGVIPRDQLEGRVTMPTGNLDSFKLVEVGDFVISLRSFQGGIEYSEYKGIVSPAYTVLKPVKEIDNSFYRFYFKSADFIGHLAIAVIGIRDGKQISYEDFCFVKIPYPRIEEQKAISAILIQAEKEIELAKEKLSNLQSQKRGLMQQLLTGKKRVSI